MAKLQNRISNIKEYFKGLDIQNGFYIVKVQYGNRWGAYPTKDETIKVAKSEELHDEWYYYADVDNVELDDVFDLIDETIQMNLNALQKVELLKDKIEELKNIFENTSLEELKTLEFKFSAPKKTKTRKSSKKKENTVTDEINNEIDEVNNNVEEQTQETLPNEEFVTVETLKEN